MEGQDRVLITGDETVAAAKVERNGELAAVSVVASRRRGKHSKISLAVEGETAAIATTRPGSVC